MANSYTVVTPSYSSENFSFNKAESDLLTRMGFTVTEDYLFTSEYLCSLEEDEFDEGEQQGDAWKLFERLFNKSGTMEMVEYDDVLQSYLKRINSDKYIALNGAYYSDRESYDSSGGFITYITKDIIKYKSTTDILFEFINEK